MAEGTPTRDQPPPPAPHLVPRAVPWRHAFEWYEEAMQLFKLRPATWMLLAFVALVVDVAAQSLPDPWSLLGKVFTPLVACGLLYASATADRNAAPRVALAFRAFALPAGAVVAILSASFVPLGAEAAAAWWIADMNLLTSAREASELTATALFGIYTIGVLSALPVTFVPFAVIFEAARAGAAFGASWRAFVLNTPALIVYGAISLALLWLGVMTLGLGLLLVLPLSAAASYAAWKDVFAVKHPPDA